MQPVQVEAKEWPKVTSKAYVIQEASETVGLYEERVHQLERPDGESTYRGYFRSEEVELSISYTHGNPNTHEVVVVSTATGQALTEPRIIHTNTVYSLASVRTGERVYINVVDEQGDTYEEPYTLTKVAETDLGDQQVLELAVGDYQYTKEGLMIGKYEGQLVMEAIEYVASLEVYAPYVYFNIQYNVTYKFENRKTNEVVYFKVREGAGDDEYTNSFGWVQNGSDW